MAYQVPSKNHPWRQYANRREDTQEERKLKSVKTFICEIAEAYTTIEIYSNAYGKDDKFYLEDLPQNKQASWIVGMLKKYYKSY
jgi:hypothetical protein